MLGLESRIIAIVWGRDYQSPRDIVRTARRRGWLARGGGSSRQITINHVAFVINGICHRLSIIARLSKMIGNIIWHVVDVIICHDVFAVVIVVVITIQSRFELGRRRHGHSYFPSLLLRCYLRDAIDGTKTIAMRRRTRRILGGTCG